MPVAFDRRLLERGFANALRFLREFPEELAKRVEADVIDIALAVQEEAKRFAPVDTGALKKSIRIRRIDALRIAVLAGDVLAHYAGWVEFGTSKAPPQPFMRPAIASVLRDKAPAKFAEGMNQAIARVALRTLGRALREGEVVSDAALRAEFERAINLRGGFGPILRARS